MSIKTTYTAPAVIASFDATQNTKGPGPLKSDGDDGITVAPGSVGFSL